MAEQIEAEEREAKNRKQEMKMMEERIREKQTVVDRLESALSSLNIAGSPDHMKFMTSPPVARDRSGREEEGEGMGRGGGGDRERLF